MLASILFVKKEWLRSRGKKLCESMWDWLASHCIYQILHWGFLVNTSYYSNIHYCCSQCSSGMCNVGKVPLANRKINLHLGHIQSLSLSLRILFPFLNALIFLAKIIFIHFCICLEKIFWSLWHYDWIELTTTVFKHTELDPQKDLNAWVQYLGATEIPKTPSQLMPKFSPLKSPEAPRFPSVSMCTAFSV